MARWGCCRAGRHAGLFGIDAICLSHLHADHCLDLASYWVARRYAPGGPKPPIPVYAPSGAAERMALAYGPDPDSAPRMTDAFHFTTLTPGSRRIGPFLVTTERMNHPVETFGFRVEHGGRILAYSADTGPCEALVGLARRADLLLCEASFLEGTDLPGDLHLTGRRRGARRARRRAPPGAHPPGAMEQRLLLASQRGLHRYAVAGRPGPRVRPQPLRPPAPVIGLPL